MKQIILLGPKHSGKTSVGKVLAEKCSCGFIDLDEEITNRTGKTPRQLYNEGIEKFKKAEIDSFKQLATCYLLPATCHIIATGGGIIDNDEAVKLLKQLEAIKVYLNISAATAWQRISAAGELPPFLQTDNPQETHRILHERRSEAYSQFANIVIDAEGKTPEEIAGIIVTIISSYIV